MKLTIVTEAGRVTFRDDEATIGETTLNDLLAAFAGVLTTVGGQGEEHIVLPFGFAGAEVAPTEDE